MKPTYSNCDRKVIVELGKNVFLPSQAQITTPMLSIGDHTRINGPVVIRGQQECEIGKYCAFGYHVTVITTNHDVSRPNLQLNMQRAYGFCSLEISKGPVTIGNNVWIGDNVTILSGVSIGHGSVVGAGAVVTSDIPPCSIAVGVPAKVSKLRFPKEVVDRFLELAWWDWPEDKISRNKKFFEADLSRITRGELDSLLVE
ncbi:Acetyltransferase (isoleucine patch superfamily)-like protein [Desulfatibacillum aliphaticivorans]|uniref:Acetyltransferase (Isoleucine patch superfamily)-like protein n=1 Tax=Desulfatibacillum aliphaticivorans TaxID=218208 RepID=B8FAS1_DESAL|nr:CatB-related O-acetyltransferase [Desulfatibacillum aliphaticivorans]ACL03367.1 Acetyltransferase (isoleucine patch superfamily)-like protein [Desulfatibacillum aliphaticivorans]